MQSLIHPDFYEDARNTVRFVTGIKDVYFSLRSLIVNVLLNILLFVMLVPVVVFTNLLLCRLKYKLSRSKSLEVEDLTSKQYKTTRINTDKLAGYVEQLDKINMSSNKVPFLFRLTVKLINDIEEILKSYLEKNRKVLASLNPDIKDNYKGFKPLTEKELWKERPSPYEYLI